MPDPGPLIPIDGGPVRVSFEACEWSPTIHAPALIPSGPGDCPNGARLSVGVNAIHLCRSCAALPEFSRCRRRVELPGRLDVKPAEGGVVRVSGRGEPSLYVRQPVESETK